MKVLREHVFVSFSTLVFLVLFNSGVVFGANLEVVGSLCVGPECVAATETYSTTIKLKKSDTPSIRFEQSSSSGFTAQTWDVAGNEANFFIRDVTGGSKLPFRIRPGAPTSSIDISASGFVGIGTASPTVKLDIVGDVKAANFVGSGAGLTNINALSVTGAVASATNATSCAHTSEIGSISSNNIPRWNGIQLISGTISDDGNGVMVNGTLTVASIGYASDERYKRNIQPLQQSLDKLTRLKGVSYDWRTDEFSGKGFEDGRQIGLIAQEVEKILPELVLTDDKGFKAITYDKIVPVLIEAVKEQQKTISTLQDRMTKLEAMLSGKQ
jgi:hypothetical protein